MKKSDLKEYFFNKYSSVIENVPTEEIWNFFEPHLKLRDPKPKIQIPLDKIKRYKEIFPNITFPTGKRARSADKEIEKAFQWYFKNYPEHTDWETIFQATNYYIQEKERDNWQYASTSQYFIVKFKTPSMPVSILVDYYERLKNNDVREEQYKTFEPKIL